MPRQHLDGSLNGTTPVTLIYGPADGLPRENPAASIFNEDSASVTLRVYYYNGASDRNIFNGSLAQDARWSMGDEHDKYRLDKPDQAIRAVLSGAAATKNPTFVSSWDE